MAISAVTSTHGLGGHPWQAQRASAVLRKARCARSWAFNPRVEILIYNAVLVETVSPPTCVKMFCQCPFILVVLFLCFVNPTFVLCYFLFKFLKPCFPLRLDALGEHPHISTPHIVCRAVNFVIRSINVNPTRLLLRPTSRWAKLLNNGGNVKMFVSLMSSTWRYSSLPISFGTFSMSALHRLRYFSWCMSHIFSTHWFLKDKSLQLSRSSTWNIWNLERVEWRVWKLHSAIRGWICDSFILSTVSFYWGSLFTTQSGCTLYRMKFSSFDFIVYQWQPTIVMKFSAAM